jgi:hypothetical protein
VIIDNVSGDEGGGIENTGSLTLERTQVSDNDGGSGNGGGINNEGRLSMTGGSLARNRSRWNGGGLQQLGYALLTDVTIDQNQASGWYRPAFYYSHGGGIAIGNTTTYQWDAWTYISGGTITNNWAQDGGGIFSDGTRVTVQGTSFAGNSPNNCSPAFAGC